jgi:hypothetical protein
VHNLSTTVVALVSWLVSSGVGHALSGYLTTIRDTDEGGLGGYQPVVELCNYDYPYDLFFSSTHTHTITVCSGQIHVMDDEGPHHLYGHGDLESLGMPRLVDYFTSLAYRTRLPRLDPRSSESLLLLKESE